MRQLLATIVFATLSTLGLGLAYADAIDVAALDRSSSLSVGMFGYAMTNGCCSSPALLSGFELTGDHHFGSHWGVRARTGIVVAGIDEIDGVAPHFEVGAFRRIRLSERAALDASVFGGVEYGGLDHKGMVEDDVGPTAAAEVGLEIALTRSVLLTMGGGYRLSYAQNDPGAPAQGFVIRHALAWSF